MNIIIKNIPNSITCLNILSGVLSIICSTYGEQPLWGLNGFAWGYIFIGIAAAADFLDGFAARLLHAYSELGKELDSLCDLVSFGVAPAISLYFCLEAVSPVEWLKWCSVLIPVAGALRLARFNIDTRQTENFIGLPIPANAIFWIGFTSICRTNEIVPGGAWVFLIILLIECWLMVSPVRLFSLKFKTWGLRENFFRWILILTAVVLVFCMGVGGLMWLIVAYVIWGLLDSSTRKH